MGVGGGRRVPATRPYRVAGESDEARTVGVVDVITDRGAGAAQAATGIVLGPGGLLITAAHVVDGSRLWVSDPDGAWTYSAQVVGVDDVLDVAVLRVPGIPEADQLVSARVGDSITVEQGDLLDVVGNAGGRGPLRQTRSRVWDTAAVIDSTDPREAARGPSGALLTGMFALDGGVVAGDSGGALLNSHGQVVAMILAYTSTWCDPPAGGCGGYAIPINRVLREGVRSVIDRTDSEQHGSG
jgi:S1-C subfamily serine protease